MIAIEKWKVIGVRVLQESDLPERLKKVSEITRMTYGEILDELISGKLKDLESTASETVVSTLQDERIAELEARVETLLNLKESSSPAQVQDDRIAALETKVSDISVFLGFDFLAFKVKSALEAQKNVIKERGIDDLPTTDEGETDDADEETLEQLDPYEQTKLYIVELWETGKTPREIAALLNAEGRLTKSGAGTWNSGLVGLVLKKPKAEKAAREQWKRLQEINERLKVAMEKMKVKPDEIEAATEEMQTMFEDGAELEEIEEHFRVKFTPDPPRRRGRPKKAKAETPTEPE